RFEQRHTVGLPAAVPWPESPSSATGTWPGSSPGLLLGLRCMIVNIIYIVAHVDRDAERLSQPLSVVPERIPNDGSERTSDEDDGLAGLRPGGPLCSRVHKPGTARRSCGERHAAPQQVRGP